MEKRRVERSRKRKGGREAAGYVVLVEQPAAFSTFLLLLLLDLPFIQLTSSSSLSHFLLGFFASFVLFLFIPFLLFCSQMWLASFHTFLKNEEVSLFLSFHRAVVALHSFPPVSVFPFLSPEVF